MITLTNRPPVLTRPTIGAANRVLAGAFVGAALLSLGGCMGTGSYVGAPSAAVTTPLVLNNRTAASGTATTTAGSTTVKPATTPVATTKAAPGTMPATAGKSTPTPTATAKPKTAPAAPAAAVASAPTAPPQLAPPGPGVVQPPAGTAAAAAMADPQAAEGYPNINVPPASPDGTVLSPDERKKVIDELQALRDRQKQDQPDTPGQAPLNAAELSKAAQSHGKDAVAKITKCSDPKSANDPACQTKAEPQPGPAPAAADNTAASGMEPLPTN